MASLYVSDSAAAKSISAFVVLSKRGEKVATVRIHHGNSRTLVNVFQSDKAAERSALKSGLTRDALSFQHDTASGGGYDKATSALSGMWIDGHVMGDHSSPFGTPKKPAGRSTYPRDWKAPAGYHVANFQSLSKATGRTIYRDHWMTEGAKALGLPSDSPLTDGEFERVADKARDLEIEWQASDDCEQGYSSCYKSAGLKYLEEIGYRVIQAI